MDEDFNPTEALAAMTEAIQSGRLHDHSTVIRICDDLVAYIKRNPVPLLTTEQLTIVLGDVAKYHREILSV